ncbi:MAG TPA: hemolysin family protein [Solirubrobacterales bacterium]|jgi:CBS domain containing-hemolysin-like protein|nr:hemolysin family protein [Solirubrobacterales bacterium]
MTTVLLLLLVVLLVLVNGFFVAAEFAIVRSRRSRIEQLANEGDRRAASALRQMDHVDEYVATSQVGITLASIGLGFAGEPAIADLIEPILDGPLGHGAAVAISFALAYAIVTLLHVIFGEQAPKLIGIAGADTLMLRLTRPLEFFRRAFHPLTVLTNRPARFVVSKILRIELSQEDETSPEELRLLISRGAERGRLDPGEAGHLVGVFHLHEQEAREIMTPIPAVVTVNADETVEVALRRCVTSGHTRLVVVEGDNPDKVRGIAHNNSLVRLYMNAGPDASIEPAIRDVPIFPETKPLDDLLAELQRQRSSLCVVVDEYGRTVGIVTVEDILEEVVGEIEDETDPRATSLRRLADGDWYVRGHVSLGDLLDEGIALPVDTDAYNSIGGYIFSELGRLPRRGDKIMADGYEIRVESVRENRIVAVRIHQVTAEHRIPTRDAAGQPAQPSEADEQGAREAENPL